MLRTFRAFAFLRWRILRNSVERTGGRDRLERFSLGLEQLAPVLAALVVVPTAVLLASTAAATGWALAGGAPPGRSVELICLLLLGACAAAAVVPLLLGAPWRAHPVQFLLLPIPRTTLYLAQSSSVLVDPWMLPVIGIVVAMPLGIAAGGNPPGALVGMVAGLLLLGGLAGISAMAAAILQMAVRSRRRAEILGLTLLLCLTMLPAFVPGVIDTDRRQSAPEPVIAEGAAAAPEWRTRLAHSALAVVPAQGYVLAIHKAAHGDYGAAARPLLNLFTAAAVLHLGAFGLVVRLLAAPSGRATTTGTRRSGMGWRPPGVSPGTAAVAQNQVRLALRTPRGRSVLLSPLVLFLVLGTVLFRHSSGVSFAMLRVEDGLALSAFGGFLSLVCILPLATNQFATDRSGLTLILLSPLPPRALLAGKALGNAYVAALPAGICLIGAVTVFPSGHPALWVSIPLSLVATYLLLSPMAAALSAIFPRAVNLNSVGGDSNAHGAASLLGVLWCALAGAPCLFLVLVATRMLERPSVAPLLLLVWCGICTVIHTVLFRPVRRLLEHRRENLAMMASRSS